MTLHGATLLGAQPSLGGGPELPECWHDAGLLPRLRGAALSAVKRKTDSIDSRHGSTPEQGGATYIGVGAAPHHVALEAIRLLPALRLVLQLIALPAAVQRSQIQATRRPFEQGAHNHGR